MQKHQAVCHWLMLSDPSKGALSYYQNKFLQHLEFVNYRSSVQLTFSSCQAKKPLFENRIPFIPESQTKTQSTLSVSYSKEAIFTPAIDSRSCMVMRKVVPAVKTTFFCSKTKTQKYACYLFSLLWTNLTLPISFKLPSYLKIFYYKAINKDDRQYSGVGWNTTDIFREKFALKENKFFISSNWKTSTKLKNWTESQTKKGSLNCLSFLVQCWCIQPAHERWSASI